MLYWVDCLSPIKLVLLLGFYLVTSFGTYCSVTSFCLICCFYFYVFGILLIFPYLREVALCRRHAMGHSSTLPSCHQSYMLSGCPLYGLSGSSCCDKLTTTDTGRCICLLVQLVASPCLVWRLLASGG